MKLFFTSHERQYGLIGGVTLFISSFLGNYLRHLSAETWQPIAYISVAFVVAGVVMGFIAFKDAKRIRYTVWKVGIFFLAPGVSWLIISVIRLSSG